jgi:hypothetical protein
MESLRSVPAFLDANAAMLPGIVDNPQRKRLDALLVELETRVGDQSGNALAAQGATRKHQSLRDALIRDHMAPIAKIAAAELPTPELQVFKMPKGTPSIEKLRSAALGMAEAAAPYAEVFVSAGLTPGFLDRLVAAANATVTSVTGRNLHRQDRVGATKGLKSTLTEARKKVRALDALVKSALKDEPALLAAWRTARRVQKYSGGAQPAVVVPPTSPATQAAA